MGTLRDILASPWVSATVPILTLLSVTVVTALRPADDREALLRGLPPPTEPLPARLAGLRRNLVRQARHQVGIGLWLAVLGFLVGCAVMLSDHAISAAGFAAALFLAAYLSLGWQVAAGVYLGGRYLGARRRVVLHERLAR